MTLKLQFDPNQKHQLDAVESVARLFEGLPRRAAEFALGGEIVPNLPPFESLSEAWLYDNLLQVQQANGIQTELAGSLEVDEGLVIEGAENVPRDGGVILASNHQSWLDAQVLGAAEGIKGPAKSHINLHFSQARHFNGLV